MEFHVEEAAVKPRLFKKFDEAAGFAVAIGATGRPKVNIDAIAWSESAARAWGGDAAIEEYAEDPDASVFERIEIRVNSVGRIP